MPTRKYKQACINRPKEAMGMSCTKQYQTKLFLKLQLSSNCYLKLEKDSDRMTPSLDRNQVGGCVVLREIFQK